MRKRIVKITTASKEQRLSTPIFIFFLRTIIQNWWLFHWTLEVNEGEVGIIFGELKTYILEAPVISHFAKQHPILQSGNRTWTNFACEHCSTKGKISKVTVSLRGVLLHVNCFKIFHAERTVNVLSTDIASNMANVDRSRALSATRDPLIAVLPSWIFIFNPETQETFKTATKLLVEHFCQWRR